MLISAAFAGEEKTISKRGLTLGGYEEYGSGLSLGGYEGYGKSYTIFKEKAVPVAVPHPVPVLVDRPVPVKVRNNYFNFSRQ